MKEAIEAGGPARGDMPGFLRGTRVMTDRGEMPVEALAPGDLVMTAAGELRRVVWVGQRRIEPRRHPRPEWVQPLRIRRGAIGNGLPRRDINLSPAAVLVIGELAVPVQALANGATVAPAAGLDMVEYLHVELDRPDTLLAEGLTAQSYRDPGNDRAAFANGGTVILLHPRPAPAMPETGAAAEALADLRRRLLQRAHALGHTITRDPGLHLRADGWPIAPAAVIGSVHRFVLPAGAVDLRIVSRAGVPAELDPAARDRRRLGVMLERVVLSGPHGQVEIAPNDPILSEGFHPAETVGGRSVRWTDGHARLPAAALAGMERLELHVAGAQPSWAGTAPPAAPATRSA